MGSQQQAVISDQNHGSGTVGFFFLDPIVQNPATAGQGVPNLPVYVHIDSFDPAAPKQMTPITDLIHVEHDDDHYVAYWQTANFALDSKLIYRIRVRYQNRDLGWADAVLQGKQSSSTAFVSISAGETLPIKFFINACGIVQCTAQDACHSVGTCALIDTGTSETALCSNPTVADGTPCSFAPATCSVGFTCQAGACSGGSAPTCGGNPCEAACTPAVGANSCQTAHAQVVPPFCGDASCIIQAPSGVGCAAIPPSPIDTATQQPGAICTPTICTLVQANKGNGNATDTVTTTCSFSVPCASSSEDVYMIVVDLAPPNSGGVGNTQAWVQLNAAEVYTPQDFQHHMTHLESPASVKQGLNSITLKLHEKAGTKLTAALRKQPFHIAVSAPEPLQCFRSFPMVSGTTTDACLASLAANGVPATIASDRSFQAQSVGVTPGATESQPVDVLTIGKDWCGNTATDDRKIIFDTTPPSIATDGLTDGEYLSLAGDEANFRPFFAVTDPNLTENDTTVLWRSGKPYVARDSSAPTGPFLLPPGPDDTTVSLCSFASGQNLTSEGDYVLTIHATDCANNVGTFTSRFTIDNTPPRITFGGVSDGQQIHGGTVTPTFTVADRNLDPGSVTATLNGVPFTSGSTVSAAGEYTLDVRAADFAGNIEDDDISFSIAICGNGTIELGENCDPPGDCCGSTCTFSTAGTVCRAAQNSCQTVATCSGFNATCPPNGAVSSATCGQSTSNTTCSSTNNCTTTQTTVTNAPVRQVIAQPGIVLRIAPNTTITNVPSPLTISVESTTDPAARPSSLPPDARLATPIYKLGPSGARFSPAIDTTLLVSNNVNNPIAWLCDDQGLSCQQRSASISLDPSGNLKRTRFSVEHFSLVFLTYGPSGETLTQHNDNLRSGINGHERLVSPANVKNFDSGTNKGPLWEAPVIGSVYAQPLYAADVGGQNLLIVATMANFVQAFNPIDGSQIWTTFLGNPLIVGAGPDNSDSSIGPGGYTDIQGFLGILSTPVLTPQKDALFVVAMHVLPHSGDFFQMGGLQCEDDDSSQGPCYMHVLYKMDPSSGQVLGATQIKGVATNPDGSGFVFRNHIQNQRPGLLWSNGIVYVAFSSFGDNDNYHGWVFAYDGTGTSLPPVGSWVSTKGENRRGGIWQAGQGPAADEQGNVYLMTGNSCAHSDIGGCNGTKDSTDFGESFVKLSPNLALLDFFAPYNRDLLDQGDGDLGAGGVLLAPTSAGLRIVGGGKESKLYVLDPNNLGGFHDGADNVIQSIFVPNRPQLGTVTSGDATGDTKHIHGSPVLWTRMNGLPLLYVWPEQYPLVSYEFNGSFQTTSDSQLSVYSGGKSFPVGQTFSAACDNSSFTSQFDWCDKTTLNPEGMPGGMLTLSWDGLNDSSAVLWATHPWVGDANKGVVTGVLRAFDPVTLQELWNSGPFDHYAKFSPPTVANGHVYVGGLAGSETGYQSATVRAYGLTGVCTPNCVGAFCGEGDGCGGQCTATNSSCMQTAPPLCWKIDPSNGGFALEADGSPCGGVGVCQAGFCITFAADCTNCTIGPMNGQTDITCTCPDISGLPATSSLQLPCSDTITNCFGNLHCGQCISDDNFDLALHGGTTGPNSVTVSCPPGGEANVLSGVYGRSGSFIDRLGLVCESGTTSAFGGSGGSDFGTIVCPQPGQVVVGFSGRAGNFIDHLGVLCAFSDEWITATMSFLPEEVGSTGGTGGTEWMWDICPLGSAVYKVNLTYGSFVNSFQAVCGKLPPQLTQ